MPQSAGTLNFNLGGSSGSSFGKPDLSSSQGLLALAMGQGGAVGAAATEMAHPTTGILSSISSGLKNSFRKFVDIISVPSQAVAGIISPSVTVKEAIEKNISPSDIIFGEKKKNANLLEKTGSFLVRTATDILLDPTTYITFGASQGALGLRAGTQVILGENAAAKTGKAIFEAATLNKEGKEVYTFLKGVERQLKGDTAYEFIRTGDEALDLAGENLQRLVRNTLDAPLNENFARRAISQLLEAKPGLALEYLDKGGIKVFGKSILSGQRIGAMTKAIPGMTKLDKITEQPRLAIEGLFNPWVKKGKDSGLYYRIPAGMREVIQSGIDYGGAFADQKVRALEDVVKQFDLSPTEGRFLMAAVENGLQPTNERLFGAFKYMLGYADEDWEQLVKSGHLSKVVRMDNFAPHVLVKEGVGSVSFRLPPSVNTGATEMRKKARFINDVTGAEIVGHADALGLTAVKGADELIFTDKTGATFKRVVEPLTKVSDQKAFTELEETLLKDPKVAAKMMDDMKTDGFEGFDDNLITAWAARGLKNTKAITMKYMLRDLASNFGVPASVGKSQGYVRIESTALKDAADDLMLTTSKEGEELLYHPSLAAYIENFSNSLLSDDATMGFLQAFDKAQNMWKATVTSIFPSFHGRNAISNVLQNFLDLGVHALNPKIHALSTQLIYNDRKLQKLQRQAMATGDKGKQALAEIAEITQRTMFTDSSGYKWSYGELRQVAKNNNIAFTTKIVTSTDVMRGPKEISKAFFPAEGVTQKAGRFVAAPFRFGQDVVGRTLEEQARLVNFIANLRETGDVTTAALRTKMFLFDYGSLTNFEKLYMKRLMPFYTFTRKNLELQARTLMEAPGRIGAEVHAIRTLGEVISGGDQLTEEEKDALPDWIRSGVSILTKKNGDQVNLIANLGTPLEQPFQVMQGNVLLGSVSPLIRLPLEQMSGYSFFQGKPLSEVTNAAAFSSPLVPKFVKDLIGYTEIKGKKSNGDPYTWSVALHPEMMNFILNMPPTTRVYTALKQMEAVDVSEQAKIFQQLTGVRPYSFDLDRERKKRENEMKDKLEDLLTKAGVTAKFETTYIPKAQKEALYSL